MNFFGLFGAKTSDFATKIVFFVRFCKAQIAKRGAFLAEKSVPSVGRGGGCVSGCAMLPARPRAGGRERPHDAAGCGPGMLGAESLAAPWAIALIFQKIATAAGGRFSAAGGLFGAKMGPTDGNIPWKWRSMGRILRSMGCFGRTKALFFMKNGPETALFAGFLKLRRT